MKVYVMFDPLYERVVCVHEEANMTCDKCEHIGWNDGYGISEKEFEVEPSISKARDIKLDNLGVK